MRGHNDQGHHQVGNMPGSRLFPSEWQLLKYTKQTKGSEVDPSKIVPGNGVGCLATHVTSVLGPEII